MKNICAIWTKAKGFALKPSNPSPAFSDQSLVTSGSYDSSVAKSNCSPNIIVILTLNDQPNYAYQTKQLYCHSVQLVSDQIRRAQFEHSELQKRLLKSVINSRPPIMISNVNLVQRFDLLGLTRTCWRTAATGKGSITRVRNRCVLSAHPSAIGKHGLSRIMFRKLAGFGKIPGLIKL